MLRSLLLIVSTITTQTITNLCNMKQMLGENIRNFIQRWRLTCNGMNELIFQSHLRLIVNDLLQFLDSLISSSQIIHTDIMTRNCRYNQASVEFLGLHSRKSCQIFLSISRKKKICRFFYENSYSPNKVIDIKCILLIISL